jgi:hypothetical protein
MFNSYHLRLLRNFLASQTGAVWWAETCLLCHRQSKELRDLIIGKRIKEFRALLPRNSKLKLFVWSDVEKLLTETFNNPANYEGFEEILGASILIDFTKYGHLDLASLEHHALSHVSSLAMSVQSMEQWRDQELITLNQGYQQVLDWLKSNAIAHTSLVKSVFIASFLGICVGGLADAVATLIFNIPVGPDILIACVAGCLLGAANQFSTFFPNFRRNFVNVKECKARLSELMQLENFDDLFQFEIVEEQRERPTPKVSSVSAAGSANGSITEASVEIYYTIMPTRVARKKGKVPALTTEEVTPKEKNSVSSYQVMLQKILPDNRTAYLASKEYSANGTYYITLDEAALTRVKAPTTIVASAIKLFPQHPTAHAECRSGIKFFRQNGETNTMWELKGPDFGASRIYGYEMQQADGSWLVDFNQYSPKGFH